jgi:hypothetical protein
MEEIIDKYFEEYINVGLNILPTDVDQEMADSYQDKNEEWRRWFPIRSKVRDEEISDYENYIGYKFPYSFKRFLKHKHFYELEISECSFCAHSINSWRGSLTALIFEGYPREFLIDKGKIPFANWSDWGLLCFDTSIVNPDNEYPIVLWDHEKSDEFEPKYENFESMMYQLDKENENYNS